MRKSKRILAVAVAALFMTGLSSAYAADAAKPEAALQQNINIVWTCVAAFLVMFMQPGFAMVEAGFTRAKNVVNILMKNFMDFCIGSIVFFILGFGLMFGATKNGWFGTSMFCLSGTHDPGSWTYTFWMFQVVFAATSATIVSGAMAERTKFVAYLVYSAVISLVIYPMFGKWAWGGLLLGDAGTGWLQKLGFVDFAGSTVVHSVGGWLALAGAAMLGPRLGKYGPDGKPRAIIGHSFSLASLGVFILWFGWFGFNPGSTTAGTGDIGRIAVTTNLAGAAGSIGAMLTAWILFKKPDASMILNGILAGLVGITAPCATVTPVGAIFIGLIAGVLVVFSILFVERVLRVDDPVGAVSVHGVCGAWGTLSAGLFGAEKVLGLSGANTGLLYGGGFKQIGVQLTGIVTAFVWAFGFGLLLFFILKHTVGLRVSKEEELRGLDIDEHGMEGYSGFQIFTTQ